MHPVDISNMLFELTLLSSTCHENTINCTVCVLPNIAKCCLILTWQHLCTDCRADQFRCNSGQCTTVRSMCDGVMYCVDGSDQANCCEYCEIDL